MTIDQINSNIHDRRAGGYPEGIGRISDGYHTFDELYAHRIALFKALSRALFGLTVYEADFPWKSKLQSNGTMEEGWFIAGIGSATGKQITYHIPISEWDEWCANEIPYAPAWDGHTSADVIKRLKSL
ncbi:WDGH domain-containing protein [Chitinophaga pinensis]|uniref:WDGH domain-containing protein n=1 Tax=Chitinophaga pinensis (strain ATCC 43595 / DSM 2588 / LMG 13176 / NBRC 15968 / NCIMB 11800 / UQM 2034) TaxID=485918 RepID=A0A979G5Z3_CHIPD|nr:hypothetical protein [Chitinophaga pinensis]ACU61345.1 conserved hypothetical protein [Chitinophaga pinensis DSM 2588]